MNAVNGTHTMRDCPVEGCQVLRHGHHLMCVGHWKKTPEALRRKVAITYAAYRDNTDPNEKRAAYRVWFAAATEAISWHVTVPAEKH